jgi:two-component system, LytTR family, response regulator
MITCSIVDDELQAVEILKKYIAKVPFLQLKSVYYDAVAAVHELQQQPVDVIFLDIEMPDCDGTTVASLLPASVEVIFTTAHPHYAVEAFNLNAADYLLKPFDFGRFYVGCIKLLQKNKQEQYPVYTFVKDGYDWIKLPIDDVMFVQAEGNYVQFQLRDKKLLSRVTMKEALELLPQKKFMQVHRSYIVNIDKVDRFNRESVFINVMQIPVGQHYKEALETLIRTLPGRMQ